MKKEIIILSAIILSACASATKTRLPDGEIGYKIDCSGYAISWAECGVKAYDICQGGFTEISSNIKESSDTNRIMLIKCNSKI